MRSKAQFKFYSFLKGIADAFEEIFLSKNVSPLHNEEREEERMRIKNEFIANAEKLSTFHLDEQHNESIAWLEQELKALEVNNNIFKEREVVPEIRGGPHYSSTSGAKK